MKSFIKYILQRVLGYEKYLYIFANFKIKTLHSDKKENDFFHFISLLPNKPTVLDIGANLGVMSYYLAKQNGALFAFEPEPTNNKICNKIIERYQLSNIKLFDFALGDKNGEIEMILPIDQKVRMQGLTHVKHDSITDFNEGEIFKVAVKKLDEVTEIKTLPKIDGIKIDVENFEYFVLLGAEELLKKHKPIIYIELWDNENRTNCFQFIQNMGYKIWVILDNKLVLFNKEKHQTQNFIFSI